MYVYIYKYIYMYSLVVWSLWKIWQLVNWDDCFYMESHNPFMFQSPPTRYFHVWGKWWAMKSMGFLRHFDRLQGTITIPDSDFFERLMRSIKNGSENWSSQTSIPQSSMITKSSCGFHSDYKWLLIVINGDYKWWLIVINMVMINGDSWDLWGLTSDFHDDFHGETRSVSRKTFWEPWLRISHGGNRCGPRRLGFSEFGSWIWIRSA